MSEARRAELAGRCGVPPVTLLVAILLSLPAIPQQHEVDPSTGLVIGPGWEDVRAHCGACHSLALVTQNRGDAEHWRSLIRWMQASQNLWDLGPAETQIVDYLAAHYGAPAVIPRRQPLVTEWQQLEQGEPEP